MKFKDIVLSIPLYGITINLWCQALASHKDHLSIPLYGIKEPMVSLMVLMAP